MRGAASCRERAGGIANPTPRQEEVKGRKAATSPACFHTPATFTGTRLSNLRNHCCPVKKCLLRLDLDLSLQREANKSEIQRGPNSALSNATGKNQAS